VLRTFIVSSANVTILCCGSDAFDRTHTLSLLLFLCKENGGGVHRAATDPTEAISALFLCLSQSNRAKGDGDLYITTSVHRAYELSHPRPVRHRRCSLSPLICGLVLPLFSEREMAHVTGSLTRLSARRTGCCVGGASAFFVPEVITATQRRVGALSRTYTSYFGSQGRGFGCRQESARVRGAANTELVPEPARPPSGRRRSSSLRLDTGHMKKRGPGRSIVCRYFGMRKIRSQGRPGLSTRMAPNDNSLLRRHPPGQGFTGREFTPPGRGVRSDIEPAKQPGLHLTRKQHVNSRTGSLVYWCDKWA